jgi:murein L,D-transpeptidase YcbB/YkuD
MNSMTDDALVGKWTSRVLAKSNMSRFYQAMLSLEKWRWKKEEEFPERYVRVNIAAYTLKLWDNNKVLRKHRTVCGAYGTQTPEFHATLKRFITNPFWHLPYSIASTESLYGVKKDSNYFIDRGMKLFREGAEVDPNTVDWSVVTNRNFRYRIRQDGGGSNSLGRVKFLFPNSHSVYFHDTPSKRLFQNDIRAYSHGCIRLHNPFDFAKTLLEIDEQDLTADEFDTLIVNGVQQIIELNTRFEVYIEYYTATGDSTGSINFHPDIYGRDERYLTKIKRKFVD